MATPDQIAAGPQADAIAAAAAAGAIFTPQDSTVTAAGQLADLGGIGDRAQRIADAVAQDYQAWSLQRRPDDMHFVVTRLMKLRPKARPSEVDKQARREVRYEKAFADKAAARIRRDLPKMLSVDDPVKREQAIVRVLDRERRYAVARQAAMEERIRSTSDRMGVKERSPLGAYWQLGAARNHTPDCLAFAGKVWPWSVLDVHHPLLHVGCKCSLVPVSTAIRRGLLTADDVPDEVDARTRAARIAHEFKLAEQAGATAADWQLVLEEARRVAEGEWLARLRSADAEGWQAPLALLEREHGWAVAGQPGPDATLLLAKGDRRVSVRFTADEAYRPQSVTDTGPIEETWSEAARVRSAEVRHFRSMDRGEMERTLEDSLHPLKLDPEHAIHPRSGFSLRVGRERRVHHPEPNVDGPARFDVVEHPPIDADWRRIAQGAIKVDEEPIRHVYRGVSEDEWRQAQERGFIQSDQRGVIVTGPGNGWSGGEGTNAAADPRDAFSYLPYGDTGRIVKIRVEPGDGWFTRHEDSYLRTRSSIPLDRVEAVTPVFGKDAMGRESVEEAWQLREEWDESKHPREHGRFSRVFHAADLARFAPFLNKNPGPDPYVPMNEAERHGLRNVGTSYAPKTMEWKIGGRIAFKDLKRGDLFAGEDGQVFEVGGVGAVSGFGRRGGGTQTFNLQMRPQYVLRAGEKPVRYEDPGPPKRDDRPPAQMTLAEFAAHPDTMWHGTKWEEIGGPDANPLVHVGDWLTAHEALAAQVAGQHAPGKIATETKDGAHPLLVPVRIDGPMAGGVRHDFVGDRRPGEVSAEAMLRGLLKRGDQPRHGYYYLNEGEGVRHVRGRLAYATSAVVPNASWLKTHEDYVREALAAGEHVPDRVLADYPHLKASEAPPISEPGRDSRWTHEQRAAVWRTVEAAVARNPELLQGEHRLRGVTFTSTPIRKAAKLLGVKEREVSELLSEALSANAVTGNPSGWHELPNVIVINDDRAFDPSRMSDQAQTVEGLVSHELGHSFFFAQDVGESASQGLLIAHNLFEDELGDRVSFYSHANAMEALAELYSAKFAAIAPGETTGLPSDIEKRFSALLDQVKRGGRFPTTDVDGEYSQYAWSHPGWYEADHKTMKPPKHGAAG